MINFNGKYSSNILLRLVVLLVIAGAIMVFNRELLEQVYFHNQLTNTGVIINASIFGLFIMGLGKVIVALSSRRGSTG